MDLSFLSGPSKRKSIVGSDSANFTPIVSNEVVENNICARCLRNRCFTINETNELHSVFKVIINSLVCFIDTPGTSNKTLLLTKQN